MADSPESGGKPDEDGPVIQIGIPDLTPMESALAQISETSKSVNAAMEAANARLTETARSIPRVRFVTRQAGSSEPAAPRAAIASAEAPGGSVDATVSRTVATPVVATPNSEPAAADSTTVMHKGPMLKAPASERTVTPEVRGLRRSDVEVGNRREIPERREAGKGKGGRPPKDLTSKLHAEWVKLGSPKKITAAVCDELAEKYTVGEFDAAKATKAAKLRTKYLKKLRDRIRTAIRRVETRSATKLVS